MTTIIEDIIALEWEMENQIDTKRCAPCIRDKNLFIINRKSYLTTWNQILLENYYRDLCSAKAEGRNMMNEKYCFTLKLTHPSNHSIIKERLPELSLEQLYLIDWISEHLITGQECLAQTYPRLVGKAESIRSNQGNPCLNSFESHIRGELSTLSVKTLRAYAAHIEELQKRGHTLNQMIYENLVASYGYQTLETAESFLVQHRR